MSKEKKSEAQDAIELLGMELEEKPTLEDKAAFIVEKLPAIKRAYQARNKEVSGEIEAAVTRPVKDAPVDELIAFNEDRKTREHQQEVRLNTVDRLERQIKMGKVMGWEGTTVDIFNDMHAMICGDMLAR